MTESPTTSPRPYEVRVSSALMPDVVPVGDIAVDLASPSPVALFANPDRDGQCEALLITTGGELRYLKRTEGGWALDSILPGEPVIALEVVVAVAPDGAVWAMYINPDNSLALARLNDGTWTITQANTAFPGTNDHYKHLTVCYRDSHYREVSVFAWDADGAGSLRCLSWILARSHAGEFPWLRYEPSARRADVRPGPMALCQTAAGTQLYLVDGTNRLSTAAVTYVSNCVTLRGVQALGSNVAQVLLVTSETDCSFLMTDGRFGGVASRGSGVAPWTDPGLKFNAGVATLGGDGMWSVYCVDDDRNLSVLQQVAWIPSYFSGPRPEWRRAPSKDKDGKLHESYVALPMDANVARAFVDAYPGATPTVFTVYSKGRRPSLNTRDPVTGQWSTDALQIAAGPATPVKMYRSQVTVVDANGAPVSEYTVRLSSDALTQVRIRGENYVLGPGMAADIATDLFGRVTLAAIADGLTTPGFTLSAPGLTSDVIIKPDAPVQNYLAGTGTLPLRPALTGDVLKGATVGKELLIKSTVWTTELTPAAAVGSIQGVYRAVGQNPETALASGARFEGFMIQTYDASRPKYRAFDSSEAFEAELALQRQHPQYGGFIDGLWGASAISWRAFVKAAFDWDPRSSRSCTAPSI